MADTTAFPRKVIITAFLVATVFVMVLGSSSLSRSADNLRYPFSAVYRVDVLQSDGSIGYSERHQISMTSELDWTDVIVDYPVGTPCPDGGVGLLAPEDSDAIHAENATDEGDEAICAPTFQIGELVAREGNQSRYGFVLDEVVAGVDAADPSSYLELDGVEIFQPDVLPIKSEFTAPTPSFGLVLPTALRGEGAVETSDGNAQTLRGVGEVETLVTSYTNGGYTMTAVNDAVTGFPLQSTVSNPGVLLTHDMSLEGMRLE